MMTAWNNFKAMSGVALITPTQIKWTKTLSYGISLRVRSLRNVHERTYH